MRRTIVLAGAVSFVMAFLGGLLAVTLALPAIAGAQESRIRAEQFNIVGDNGADRVMLRAGPGAGAAVWVLAADGATRRVAMATGAPAATGGTTPEAAGFNLFALDGTRLGRLGTAGPEDVTFVNLWLGDREGRPRVVLGVADDGTPSIQLRDANGAVTWAAR
jgi:hypothetical protein